MEDKKRLPARKCDWCGTVYIPKRINSATCSYKCTKNRRNQQNKDNYFKRKYGKANINKICRICSEEFTTTRTGQVCCSKECSLENKKRRSIELQRQNRYQSQYQDIEVTDEPKEINPYFLKRRIT